MSAIVNDDDMFGKLDGQAPIRDMSPEAGDARPAIDITGLSKQFSRHGGEQVTAIDNLSLQIEQGEFVVLVGPSGCGKTTLLRCLAGLESPDGGTVNFGGVTVFSAAARRNLPPEKRDAAMLFQTYALWPHMTVFDNVAYPLRSQRVRKGQIRSRVMAILDKVQCGNLAEQHPGQISGGQQQRVALARALVADNKIVFFDEPLSNIDAKVRDQLRWEILRLQRDVGFTAIYVTHDQTEALALADKLIVLRNGKIAQGGTPSQVYDRPISAYVARFMGPLNELPGKLVEHRADIRTYQTDIGLVRVDTSTTPFENNQALLGFRPTACTLHANRADVGISENLFQAQLKAEIFLGTHYEYVIQVNQTECRCWTFNPMRDIADNVAWLHIPAAGVRLLAQ